MGAPAIAEGQSSINFIRRDMREQKEEVFLTTKQISLLWGCEAIELCFPML